MRGASGACLQELVVITYLTWKTWVMMKMGFNVILADLQSKCQLETWGIGAVYISALRNYFFFCFLFFPFCVFSVFCFKDFKGKQGGKWQSELRAPLPHFPAKVVPSGGGFCEFVLGGGWERAVNVNSGV